MASPIAIISWKARELGLTYGELEPLMRPGDLAAYTEEYEQAKSAEWARLNEEAQERSARRGGRLR